MIILTLRTDKPEAEIGLYDDSKKLNYISWQAHRELSKTILIKIEELLSSQDKVWADIKGIVIYKGPGSFTGLRIGFSVANALASELDISIKGTNGNNWIDDGLRLLRKDKKFSIALPEYGGAAHTTLPKK